MHMVHYDVSYSVGVGTNDLEQLVDSDFPFHFAVIRTVVN